MQLVSGESESPSRVRAANISGVLSRDIGTVWESVEPLILSVLQTDDGKCTVSDIKRFLKNRDMQLWVVYGTDGTVSGCCLTQIQCHPSKKVCFIPIIAGLNPREWKDHLEDIREWAREKQCETIETWKSASDVVDGWEETLGLEKARVIFRCEL